MLYAELIVLKERTLPQNDPRWFEAGFYNRHSHLLKTIIIRVNYLIKFRVFSRGI